MMRLDKLLAHSGFGTRNEVKKMIKNGDVIVNNIVIKKEKTQVDPNNDIISVMGEIVEYQEFVYYMLNKPAGYVSATKDNVYPTVIELIDDYYRDDLFPVGRLDVDTEGLLLLTNDGVLAHQLLSPKKHCPKVYYAKIKGVISDDDVQKFLSGLMIADEYQCQEAHLQVLSTDGENSEIIVEIYEGKFHQVKKMFLAVGKEVTYLKRIRMKELDLDESLKLGEYRHLTDEELDRLKKESMLQ